MYFCHIASCHVANRSKLALVGRGVRKRGWTPPLPPASRRRAVVPRSSGTRDAKRARRDVRLRHFRTEAHFWGAGGHGGYDLWRMNSLGRRNAQKTTLFRGPPGVSWVLSLSHISPSCLVDNHRMPRLRVEGFHCFNGALQGAKC